MKCVVAPPMHKILSRKAKAIGSSCPREIRCMFFCVERRATFKIQNLLLWLIRYNLLNSKRNSKPYKVTYSWWFFSSYEAKINEDHNWHFDLWENFFDFFGVIIKFVVLYHLLLFSVSPTEACCHILSDSLSLENDVICGPPIFN